ncbi:hypothetical protein Patl_3557 [Paraglaciecola sp. T6c]|uniref:hypothetical protein n=1 Tax=Pseudoalteromonas atlantica (strain T6c / ATCC BAA-1087) TaxID=3042615 RepID=UPI00005C63ED|nr:hypothetical protein [Paraglaciecola sp. T6c]ABG42059.1 hypothetical protein Patl_3557 [Paraglaciecola sp. T6c]
MLELLGIIIAFASIMLTLSLLVTTTLTALNTGDVVKYWIMKQGMRKLADCIAKETTQDDEIQNRIKSSIDSVIGKGIARSRNAYTSFDELLNAYQQANNKSNLLPDNVELDKDKLARWFSLVEDETRGRYKGYSDVMSILIASVFVIVLQLDAITLIKDLSDQMRQNSVFNLSEEHTKPGQATNLLVSECNIPNANIARCPTHNKLYLENHMPLRPFPHNWSWNDYRSHLGGLLLSTILISLGAPFWFNTLKNILGLKDAVAMRYETKKNKK